MIASPASRTTFVAASEPGRGCRLRAGGLPLVSSVSFVWQAHALHREAVRGMRESPIGAAATPARGRVDRRPIVFLPPSAS